MKNPIPELGPKTKNKAKAKTKSKTALKPKMVFALLTLGLSWLMAFEISCAGKHPVDKERAAAIARLDSLNRAVEHKDSVESNVIFYEEAFVDYKKKYPGVDKSEYLKIARGKDQDFCLFKPNPAQTCLETADKFNDLGLKPPARDAYHAGLLSEGYNEQATNIRLWGSMGQLAIEENDFALGRSYLDKVLEVEPKNAWAKKLLATLPEN